MRRKSNINPFRGKSSAAKRSAISAFSGVSVSAPKLSSKKNYNSLYNSYKRK